MINRIGIVGLGMIGGSIAKLIKKYQPTCYVAAIDTNATSIESAIQDGVIDDGGTELSFFKSLNLDLIIIATPIAYIKKTIETLSQIIDTDLIFTDVASIKSFDLNCVIKENHSIVWGHPMAGIEQIGFSVSDVSIVENKRYFLMTESNSNSLPVIREFFTNLAFDVQEVSLTEHDLYMGLVSHFPYLMASSIVATLAESTESHSKLSKYAGPGLNDTTRVAGSDPNWGVAVCRYNKDVLIKSLNTQKKVIDRLIAALGDDDPQQLTTFLTETKKNRKELLR